MADSATKRIRAAGGRILLVDDEDSVHRVLRRILEPEGYQIDDAYDAPSALRLVDAGYDVVIADVRMPGMSGVELLEEIRRRALPVEVLILTGNGTVESAEAAGRLGARYYMLKPVRDTRDFRWKLRRAVVIAQTVRRALTEGK